MGGISIMAETSSLARALLRIVQAEASLATLDLSSSGAAEALVLKRALWLNFAEFSQSWSSATINEKIEVFPHFLRSILRGFNRLELTATSYRQDQLKNMLLVLKTLHAALTSLFDARDNGGVSTCLELCLSDFSAVLFPLVLLLDHLKEQSLRKMFGAEYEELAEVCLLLLLKHLDLCNFGLSTALQARHNGTSRPVWPQLTYALVVLCREANRVVALTALQSIASLVILCHEGAFSRSVFPGIFSNVYQICTSPQNRGSAIYSSCMYVVHALMRFCCDDSLAENAQLLAFVDTSPGTGDASALHRFLADGGTGAASVETLASVDEGSLAMGEFASMASFAQFRADLLQRLRSHYTTMYQTVLPHLSARHRIDVVRSLVQTLQQGFQFLGVHAFLDFIACVLATDASTEAQDDIPGCVRQLMQHIHARSKISYLRTLQAMEQAFMDHVHRLDSALQSPDRLLPSLRVVVNTVHVLQEQLRPCVLVHREYLHGLLRRLVEMDADMAVMAQESYVYAPLPGRVGGGCEARYYLYRFAHLRTKETEALARTFIIMIAALADLPALVEDLVEAVHKLRACTQAERAGKTASTQRLKQRINRAVALVQVVRNAAFSVDTYLLRPYSRSGGEGAQADDASPIADLSTPLSLGDDDNVAMDAHECAVCGSARAAFRCSRCKIQRYCSRAHQQSHWAAHRHMCQPATTEARLVALSPFSRATRTLSGIGDGGGGIATARRATMQRFVDPTTALLGGIDARAEADDMTGVLSTLVGRLSVVFATLLEAYTAVCASPQVYSSELAQQMQGLLALFVQSHADVHFLLYLRIEDARPAPQILDMLLVLQCAVLPCEVVAQAAKASLARLAVYAGYGQVSEMLRSQMDYIVDLLCRSLRAATRPTLPAPTLHVALSPLIRFVFSACRVAIDASAPMYVFLLADVIKDSLDCIDLRASTGFTRHAEAAQLVQLMHIYTLAIALPPAEAVVFGRAGLLEVAPLCHDRVALAEVRAAVQAHKAHCKQLEAPPTATIAQALTRMRLNLRKLFAPSDIEGGKGEDDVLGEEPGATAAEEDSSSPPPPQVRLLEDITQRCAFLLHVPSVAVQQLAVSALANALLRLVPHTTQLLPAVHKVMLAINEVLQKLVVGFVQRNAAGAATPMGTVASAVASRPVLELLDEDAMQQSRRLLLTMQASRTAQHPSSMQQAQQLSVEGADGPNQALHLLASLLELVALIMQLCPDFVRGKLQDDVLPRVLTVLFSIQDQYLASMTGAVGAAAGTQTGLDAKVRLAVLAFVRAVASVPELHALLESHGRTLVWTLLPLCSEAEGEVVRQRAREVLDLLTTHEPLFARGLLAAMRDYGAAGGDQEEGEQRWALVALDPAVYAHHQVARAPPTAGASLPRRVGGGGLFAAAKSYRSTCAALLRRHASDPELLAFAEQWLTRHSQRDPAACWHPSTTSRVLRRAEL